MSQISTVSPSEASRQGQGAARPSTKGQAAGHPLFAGLLEQAGLGLQADAVGLPLNPAMVPGGDVATDAGDVPIQEELELADWSLLGLPLTPASQESVPPTEVLPESTVSDLPEIIDSETLIPSDEGLSAAELEPATTSAAPDTEQPLHLSSDRPAVADPSSSDAEAPPSTVSRSRRSAVSIAAQQHAQATGMARLDLQGWNMAPQGLSVSAAMQASAAALSAAPLAEAALSTELGGGATDNGPQGQEPGPFQRQAGEPSGRVENLGLATGSAAAEAAAPKGFALSLGRAMGDAFDHLGTQISVWASQNMKRASISLDAGLGKALDVDVSLQDGQAHLAFRTDDAAARAALQNHAQQVMADLLARNGLGLAGLSIGARGQDAQSSGQGSERGGSQRGIRGMGSGTADPTPGPAQWVARPGRALDVYA